MAKQRNLIGYLGIYLRGISMGAADVVPGVSGGTIAFISGIYEELLDTIKGINLSVLKNLKSRGIKGTWEDINGNFLFFLLAGIATSIVSLASLISGVLEEEGETSSKIGLWSFFFGLIIASVIYVAKQLKSFNWQAIVGIVAGGALAYFITVSGTAAENNNLIFLFFAGAIAISAMILPGISGSFILVLMGAYQPVMGAIKGFVEGLKISDSELLTGSLITIAVVGAGCVIGLLSFSRLLSYLFKHQENITLATLTGFMVGSLNKIWPWKEVVTSRINSDGIEVPVVTQNLSPNNFEIIHNFDPHVGLAIGTAAAGFLIVFLLEFIGKKLGDV